MHLQALGTAIVCHCDLCKALGQVEMLLHASHTDWVAALSQRSRPAMENCVKTQALLQFGSVIHALQAWRVLVVQLRIPS